MKDLLTINLLREAASVIAESSVGKFYDDDLEWRRCHVCRLTSPPIAAFAHHVTCIVYRLEDRAAELEKA